MADREQLETAEQLPLSLDEAAEGRKPRRRTRRIKDINDVIADLLKRMAQLSLVVDDLLTSTLEASPKTKPYQMPTLTRLFALYAQTASRLGRLLRDRRALSGEAADGLAGAIAQALDEIGSETGRDL